MATYYSDYSNEYRLRLDITQGTQSTANNTTVVSWTLYLLSGNKSMSVYSTYHATVNGVASPNTTQTNVNIGFNTSVTLGSGSTTVTHNTDGTKSVPFSASFKTNSPVYYGGVLVSPGTMTISGNFALTTIPRYAEITAFTASISGLTASLSWTADKTISQWRYSRDSGSSYGAWKTVNAKSVSHSTSVTHSTTYGFRVQVKNSASGLITTSSTVSRTSPASAKITAFTASVDDLSVTMSWTADKTISQWRSSKDSGSSYNGWTTVNAKSGSVTRSASPGSTYGLRIQVIDSETGVITTSSVVSKTATKTPSTLTLDTTSQNVGGNIKWTINESYDYTHKIACFFGNAAPYILGSDSAASNTSTGTWTVPTSFANQIPNATSGSGTIKVYTYYGSTYVGAKTYTFTAKVPNNTTWQPTVPTVTITHVGSRPAGATSYVQGRSRANVVSSSTGRGGASIKSYRVIVSGIGTYYGSNITSGYLTKSGEVTITVRATDSRGYYREKESKIPVVAYSPPKLTTYTANRSPNDQGTSLATSINFSISPINNGVIDQNPKAYSIKYRETGGTWVTLVSSSDYYTRNTTHSATGVLDANKSYEVEFSVGDYYSGVTQTRNIGTAFQLLDFNATGRGMAIGKVSEGDKFEVALPAEFEKGVAFLDTREVVSASEDLPSRAISFEFKRNTSVGNPPVTAGTSYSHIINVAGWNSNEGSGGWPSQISVGAAGLAVRQATSATAWGSWKNIAEPTWADVSSKPAQATRWPTWSEVTSKPSTATRWPAWSEVTSKPDVVDSSGSNGNGRYIKFSDGTMICWARNDFGTAPATNGQVYRQWTYPHSFVGIPSVTLTPEMSTTGAANALQVRFGMGTIDSVKAVAGIENNNNSSRQFYANWYAIGRWK